MRVCIVGGTGLLGSAVCRRLIEAGHSVTLLARSRPRVHVPQHEGATLALCDVDASTDADLAALFAGHDALVYALGPDDSSDVPRDAAGFFRTHLVERTARVHRIAAAARVGASVVLSSYFATAARRDPALADRHPYIAARLQQAAAAAASGMRVCILEIPYVFATRPGLTPLWKKGYYDPYRWSPVLPVPPGGTSAATGETVADAALAALERGEAGRSYPVGDADVTFAAFVTRAISLLRGRPVRAFPVPVFWFEPVSWGMAAYLRLRGRGFGLALRWVMRHVMGRRLFVDHASTRAELGIGVHDVWAAIDETVRVSYPRRFRGGVG